MNQIRFALCLLTIAFCAWPGIVLASEGGARVWKEEIVIPTWEVGPPEVNPTFEWSSRRSDVYPYPFQEILTNRKTDKTYQACWLENEYIQVLVLPEIGGRLHRATDKTNGYEFFYWQPTIKPALVGMTGAWISGGIEWNFPHGHRPTAFSPVSYRIEEHEDGSRTVWVGETEWVFRTRWVIGLTVYPGKSVLEARVRLMNPGPLPHSFWMWTTTAVHANEDYQAIYPTRLMTGHGKQEFWNWPIHEGVDLSWWKNIPNASSFFAVEPGSFFGGYDHGQDAGTVIVGDPGIVVGKKLWTWGTSPMGRIWEDILTEGQGPYFEPQAGAYSDNQPDYRWIQPGEVKTYSHYFFPVHGIGGFKQANIHGALNLETSASGIEIGVYSTERLEGALVRLLHGDSALLEESVDLSPSAPFFRHVARPTDAVDNELLLELIHPNGEVLITFRPSGPAPMPVAEPVEDYPPPETIRSNDELWHAGELIYKFRDPAKARRYFEEALERDPGDSRTNISMAELEIKQFNYRKALQHLATAEQRDPDNGNLFYLRGVAQEALKDYGSAYDSYYRSTHFSSHYSAGYEQITRLDLRKGDVDAALEHVDRALQFNKNSSELWTLKAVILRLSGNLRDARKAVLEAQEYDPLGPWSIYEELKILEATRQGTERLLELLPQLFADDPHAYIETALEYANAGLYIEAGEVLDLYPLQTGQESPLIEYYRGYFDFRLGKESEARRRFSAAARKSVDYSFPFRWEGLDLFHTALNLRAEDQAADYYIGLIHAGAGNIDLAIDYWKEAVVKNPRNARALRNLGLAHLRSNRDLDQALQFYEQAFALDPHDSRILMELDSTREALGMDARERLEFLKKHREVVETRDDLLTAMLDLMVQNGEFKAALDYYRSHHFHNWEGRYDIHIAYMEANIGLAQETSDPAAALSHYERAAEYPPNLEVAPRDPNLRGFLYYPMALLHQQLGNTEKAKELLETTARENTSPPTLATFYQALALRELGRSAMAEETISMLRQHGLSLTGERNDDDRNEFVSSRALGHYYLALAARYSGNREEEQRELSRAREFSRGVERAALRRAQVVFANASQ